MAAGVAKPLQSTDTTPPEIKSVVEKAAERWLKNTEVADILANYETYDFKASVEPPVQPSGGTIFLFDRKQVRFFRKDGHNWRKKPDGKTVRETHEKLKVDNQDVLNCYYAHAEEQHEKFQLQRRCYWLLEGDGNMVLVHYLNVPAESLRTRTDREENLTVGEGDHMPGALQMQHVHANMGWPAGNPNMHMMYPNQPTNAGVMDPSRSWMQSDGQPARMGQMDSQAGWMGQQRQYNSVDHNQNGLNSNQMLHMQGYNAYGQATPMPQNPMQGYTGDWHQQSARQPAYNYMSHPMHPYPANNRSGVPGVDPSSGGMVARYPEPHQTSSPIYPNMGQGFQQHANMQSPNPVMNNWSPSDTTSAGGVAAGHRQAPSPGAASYEYWQGGNGPSQASQPQTTPEQPLLGPHLGNYPEARTIANQGHQNRQMPPPQVAGTAAGQLHSQPDLKMFQIIDFSPCWDYTSGGSKILVTGTLNGLAPDATLCVMFGTTEVPAVRLQPGVLRCQAPPHAPGKQGLCVTKGDGEPCSDVVEFQYQLPVKDPPNNLINSITTETSNRELQVRLVTRLLKETGMSVSGGEVGSAADVGEGKHRDMVDIAMARVNTLDSNSAERILLLLLERELKIFTQQVIQKHNDGAQLESTSINEVDEDGMGLIHIVSALGYKWAVELLLQAGAFESLRDPWGLTPLHWAAAKGHEDTIALLLRYGAECNCVSYTLGAVGGFTPADLASMNSHNGIAAYLSETHLAQRLSMLQVSDEKGRPQQSRKRQNQVDVATSGSAQEEVQHISAAAREAAEKIFRARDATKDSMAARSGSNVSHGNPPQQEQSIAVSGVTATDEEVLGQITKDWMRAGADLSAYGVKQEASTDTSPPGKDATVNAPELNLAVNRVEAIVHNPHAREQYLRMREAAERNQVGLQVPQIKSPQLESDR